jgi:mRNA interferase MazF
MSPISYNEKVGLALFCPITSQVKGYPFEVNISTSKIKGVVLSDQLKSLDWSSRKIKFICKSPSILLSKISEKFSTLLPKHRQ